MEISFKGQYDRATFYRAVRLANRPSRDQNRFLWFMFLFACGALVLMLYRIFTSGDFGGNAILLFVALILVVVIGYVFLQPFFLARKMWAQAGTRRVLQGWVTNQGFVYELEEGRNEISWGRIRRMRRADDLVALLREDGLLLVFPRQFFKRNSDWRKFLKMVQTRLGT